MTPHATGCEHDLVSLICTIHSKHSVSYQGKTYTIPLLLLGLILPEHLQMLVRSLWRAWFMLGHPTVGVALFERTGSDGLSSLSKWRTSC